MVFDDVLLEDWKAAVNKSAAHLSSYRRMIRAIRENGVHRKLQMYVKNCESARERLINTCLSWIDKLDETPLLAEFGWDLPLAACIIVLSDCGDKDGATLLSSEVSALASVPGAKAIAESYLLAQKLETVFEPDGST
jgi:hypothetical protein